MEETRTLEQSSKTHPVVTGAGVPVLVFCALGAAALTGILPTATSRSGEGIAAPVPAPQAQAPQASERSAAPAAKPHAAPAVQPKVAAAPCASCGVIEQ